MLPLDVDITEEEAWENAYENPTPSDGTSTVRPVGQSLLVRPAPTEISELSDQLRKTQSELQKVTEASKEMQGQLSVLISSSARQRQALEECLAANRPRKGLLPRSDFELVPVKNEEELATLELALRTDPEYKGKVQAYLLRQIYRADVDNRLHQAIDLIFAKPFFAQINWTGVRPICLFVAKCLPIGRFFPSARI
ncbi:uncharacterized protein LOC125760418 [Anopheles funestus]|uniref:uncharacterized protein LOC125760418 n=1 Tax=Anopheles funestus TaxID=62324 RepID=UPI0020C6B205|nr:uncharacterized protein LOC125760418 [Anopheles funestus]